YAPSHFLLVVLILFGAYYKYNIFLAVAQPFCNFCILLNTSKARSLQRGAGMQNSPNSSSSIQKG
ncbi:MAG: hypothetical protein LBB74_09875, partial [Chitinispirillales bacterium]|nr:hypothetical protein [Chitinispirillales bacterium]